MRKIIFLFFIITSNAQQKQVYKFVVESKILVESMPGFYIGLNREHFHTRIIHRDSIIEEKNLFSNGTHFFFIVKNGNWYFKKQKKWFPFYNKNKIIAPKFKIGSILFTFQPIKTEKIYDLDCIVYDLQQQDSIQKKGNIEIINQISDVNTKYWFNPKYGIIKEFIGNEVLSLIREDILNKNNN